MYRQKASYNSDMAARLQAAKTRLARFEEAGPPEALPLRQNVRMRLTGGRTAKRAVIAEGLELTGLMRPFDLEVWYGERVAVLGSNGSGKSHFLRLVACGGTDPEPEHRPVGDVQPAPVAHEGRLRLGSRVRPGWFAQTHDHPTLTGRTLLEILHRGDEHRAGKPREEAARALDRTASPGRASRRSTRSRGAAGALPDPAARAQRGDLPAPGRADRQPRPALGRGARGGARRLRGHRAGGHPRPLVRPGLRPLPGLRRRRPGLRGGRAGLGRGRVERAR